MSNLFFGLQRKFLGVLRELTMYVSQQVGQDARLGLLLLCDFLFTALHDACNCVSGVFTEIEKASRHLKGGAKKVSSLLWCCLFDNSRSAAAVSPALAQTAGLHSTAVFIAIASTGHHFCTFQGRPHVCNGS